MNRNHFYLFTILDGGVTLYYTNLLRYITPITRIISSILHYFVLYGVIKFHEIDQQHVVSKFRINIAPTLIKFVKIIAN